MADDRVNYGISLRQGWQDLESFRQSCLLVERLGFGSAWVTDHLRGPDALLEPFTALSYCAGATNRIRLGIAIAVSFARTPVHLAQAVASLDRLSGGRLEVGIGSGAPHLSSAFGVAGDDAFARFRSSLTTLKQLWTESAVTDQSRFWDLRDWPVGLRPLQDPYPPLWIGARVASALRLAAEEGTGWVGAGSSSFEDFTRQVSIVRRHVEKVGRDPASFRVAKRIYMYVSDGGPKGIEQLREWFGIHYGDPTGGERFGVTGDAAACAEQVRTIQDAGAELPILHPVFGTPEQIEATAVVADLASSG